MNKPRIYLKTSHLLLLTSLSLLAILLFTPLSRSAYILSLALRQGDSVEFAGNRIRLGLDYVYKNSEFVDDAIEIRKIKPYFAGLDDDHVIYAHIAEARHIRDFRDHCMYKPDECEIRKDSSYKIATLRTDNSPYPRFSTYSIFFNPKCNIYFSQFGETDRAVYRKFFDTFFEQNCN